MAWTLIASVSTGFTGVSLATHAATLPLASTSSILSGPAGADFSQ